MASRYDKIRTPEELIFETEAHGLSLLPEDICRAQDIIGRAAIEDLVAIANDSKRRDAFYMVLFEIWSWEEAVRFYNKHSNKPVIDALAAHDDMKSTIDDLNCELSNYIDSLGEERAASEIQRIKMRDLEKVIQKKDDIIRERERTIIELKAKLYDLITKEN